VNQFISDDRFQGNKQEEQKLYEHFLQCIETDSPEKIIERFSNLFIKATGYSDNSVRLALENIASLKSANLEFKFILNRCCHIVINHWQMHSHLKPFIPKLIYLFENTLPIDGVQSRSARKIRILVQDFSKTEQYNKLKRLSKIVRQTIETDSKSISNDGYFIVNKNKSRRESISGGSGSIANSGSIGNLIKRYPYLHQHCLLSEDSTYESQQTVLQLQAKIQRNYEIKLSNYVTYRVRLAKAARMAKSEGGDNRIIVPNLEKVKNPTLLSDRELDRAIANYIGKAERGCSYRDLSQQFLSHSKYMTNSYQDFKGNLYEYLKIDSEYGRDRFNHKLSKHLQNTLVDCHSQKLNEFLMIRTCSGLFKFLVVDSDRFPDCNFYLDSIGNLGETKTVGLLLKIVLLCSKVKPSLEKRFSILFNHYESSHREGVPWLIKSLENLQVAFSIHFGAVDLSLFKII
jgi:ribosomal protein S30